MILFLSCFEIFMENILASLPSLVQENCIYQTIPAQKPLAMVATRDIANVAAGFLLDPHWSGHRLVGVHGPEDLTWERAVMILSAELGRTIRYVQIPLDQMRQGLSEAGLPEFKADLYVELFQAIGEGRLDPAEPRTAETTTTTTLAQFATQVLKPALGKAAQAG